MKKYKIIDIYGYEFIYNCNDKEEAREYFDIENGKDRFFKFIIVDGKTDIANLTQEQIKFLSELYCPESYGQGQTEYFSNCGKCLICLSKDELLKNKIKADEEENLKINKLKGGLKE